MYQLHYEDSILSYLYPGLSFMPNAVTEFLNTLGRMRGAIRSYMQEMVAEHERFLLFDRYRLLSASRTVDYTECGYDSRMRYRHTEEAWLFLNHLSTIIGVNAIEEIASVGESKNISYKDLTQTLIKIKAGKMDGKWVVYRIKKSVQRLCGKMQFDPNDLMELKL